MEWKSLEEFPDYQFSDTGLVKKGDEPFRSYINNGYPSVTLNNGVISKRLMIHRVVAELFIGPRPNGQMVRHLDDIRQNNCVSNLAYGTHADNIRDAARNGRIARYGETNGSSKLTQKDVEEIRAVKHYRGSVTKLAKKFNVGRAAISRVKNGVTWNKI